MYPEARGISNRDGDILFCRNRLVFFQRVPLHIFCLLMGIPLEIYGGLRSLCSAGGGAGLILSFVDFRNKIYMEIAC